jgi:hypothetical protein
MTAVSAASIVADIRSLLQLLAWSSMPSGELHVHLRSSVVAVPAAPTRELCAADLRASWLAGWLAWKQH